MKKIAKRVTRPFKRFGCSVKRWIANQSPMGDEPVFDAHAFEWAARLEQNSDAIKAELESLLAERRKLPSIQDMSPTQRSLSQDDGWKSYFFNAFGRRIESSCDAARSRRNCSIPSRV